MKTKARSRTPRPPRTSIVPRAVFATVVGATVVPACMALAGCGNTVNPDVVSDGATDGTPADRQFSVVAQDVPFAVAVPVDASPPDAPFSVALPRDSGAQDGRFSVAMPLDAGAPPDVPFSVAIPLDSGRG
jgi:hypothetical protein